MENRIQWSKFWQAESLLATSNSVEQLTRVLGQEYREALGLEVIKLLVFAENAEHFFSEAQEVEAMIQQTISLAPYQAELHYHSLGRDLTGGSVDSIPLVLGGQPIGLLLMGHAEVWPDSDLTQAFLSRTGDIVVLCLSSLRGRRAFEDVLIRDPLTQLYNRRYFNDRINQELSKASRSDWSVCCIVFDIDFFKHVNDTFGYAAGDSLLFQVGQRAEDLLRSGELLARTGGEEFSVLLSDAPMKVGKVVAERIRRSVEKEPFELPEGESIQVTISCGVAQARKQVGYTKSAADDLIDRSAKALSDAKALGRNRVVAASL